MMEQEVETALARARTARANLAEAVRTEGNSLSNLTGPEIYAVLLTAVGGMAGAFNDIARRANRPLEEILDEFVTGTPERWPTTPNDSM
jgi:hypothetical protein